MLDGTFFRTIGANVRDRYRKHIFKDAKDVYGKAFKKYSTKYGIRKRANTFKRQASQYANSKAPVLTSDLLRDYSLIKTSNNGFQIGWVSQGAKVKWLKDNGRVLTAPEQPLPNGIIQYIQTQGHSYIKKKLGPNKTTIHRIGKK